VLETAGFTHVIAHIRRRDVRLGVTAGATYIRVACHQAEADVIVMEGCRIEPNRIEISAEVILVARRTRCFIERRMKSRISFKTVSERNMAVETKISIDASLAEGMAFRTAPDLVELRMCLNKAPRRDELCLRILNPQDPQEP